MKIGITKKNLGAFLSAFLLLATASAGAVDADGDGVLDLVPTQISTGWYHACALDNTGVHCWGDNSFGQTMTPNLTRPTAVSAGGGHTCALDATGAHCWGINTYGQATVPVLTKPTVVSAGAYHTCAVDETGDGSAVVCWGAGSAAGNFPRRGQAIVPALSHPIEVSTGVLHSCALDDTGVVCWGDNTSQQIEVPILSNPTAVSVGDFHSCALDSTGVVCWGANNYGQSNVPALTNPRAVSAGGYHTCALDDNGVHCWGAGTTVNGYDYEYGQSIVPVLSHPTAVSAGLGYTCGQDDVGVHCWGDNNHGEISVPTGLSFVATPLDNCPHIANADQADGDGDGLGDTCDPRVSDGNNLNMLDGSMKADYFGSVVTYVGDFNGDYFGDWAVGTPRYDIPANDNSKAVKGAGRVQIISGNDGSVMASITGNAAKDAMGFAVAGNADIDKDGFADVVVGAPNATALHVGSVTVLYGGADERRHTFWGATKNTGFGSALALGDVNGDDYADVLIGAPKDKSPASPQKAAGSVTVFDGNTLQSRKRFYGQSTNAHAGMAVAAGDVDNDGVADIIVGAPDENGVGSVRVYSSSGTELLQKLGTNKKAQFGRALASADINHDDHADIVVGAPLDDDADSNTKDAGSISVISGSNGELLSTKSFGAVKKAWLGSSVALGDVNGDGTLDIIASAPQGDNVPTATKGTGSVTAWNGATYAPIKTVYGDTFGDLFGAAVSAGDINSDGKADLIIGIPNKDVELESSVQKDAGGVKVVNATAL